MQLRLLLPAAFALASTSPLLRAQGSDSCASAQPIAGTGVFAFDNSAATTDGTPNPACNFFGQNDITLDVWFAWTAPSSGYFRVNTCAQTSVDTKIAIYAGGCAGSVIACNDDACFLQTGLLFPAIGGKIGRAHV